MKNLAAIFQKKATFSWRRVRHSKSGAEHKAMMEVVCLVADNDDGGDDDDGGGFQTQVEVNLGLMNNDQYESYQNTHKVNEMEKLLFRYLWI